MKKFHKYIFFLILFFQYFVSNSQITVYQIDITKEIGSTTWRYLRAGLHQAQEQNAKAVILRLNTYGGTVVHADSMRTAILNAPIPVYAFVDNNAASAGALIAIACDSIYMRSSASMGAATVVNETGAAMPDKYQSYMRATLRATAESHGKDGSGNWRRNPLIAEAMVDERVIVPNLCDSGKVLTLTANEAIAQKYCEGIVDNVDEIISQKLRYETYTLQEFKPSLFDDIAGFLTHPRLSGSHGNAHIRRYLHGTENTGHRIAFGHCLYRSRTLFHSTLHRRISRELGNTAFRHRHHSAHFRISRYPRLRYSRHFGLHSDIRSTHFGIGRECQFRFQLCFCRRHQQRNNNCHLGSHYFRSFTLLVFPKNRQ